MTMTSSGERSRRDNLRRLYRLRRRILDWDRRRLGWGSVGRLVLIRFRDITLIGGGRLSCSCMRPAFRGRNSASSTAHVLL
jgi:hypothetical protein